MKQITLFLLLILLFACQAKKLTLHCVADQENDIIKVLEDHYHLAFYENPDEAVHQAKEGEAILVLADNYPGELTPLDQSFFVQVEEKGLRAFIEYPSYLPSLNIGEIIHNPLERAVINSTSFGGTLDSLDILVINGLHYCHIDVPQSHLVAARVAGFDEAVFGLPESTAALLFETPDLPVLVATTCLSRPVKARYAPQDAWESLWEGIMRFLFPDVHQPDLSWIPDVLPTYELHEKLPSDHQVKAVKRGIEWFSNARMVLHKSYIDTLDQIKNTQRLKWKEDIPVGDGKHGALEAIMSVIDEDGSQPIGTVQRGDCIMETAMAFAAAGKLLDSDKLCKVSGNLINYYLKHSPAAENEWADPNHGAYGLIPWGITNYAWYRANYGDDNARQLLGIFVSSALLDTDVWNSRAMRCLIALIRTTGVNGFRGDRIDLPDFSKNGWQYFGDRDIINIAPHFESYLWACFLWAYDKTGYLPFLDKTKKAIRITMDNYPDGWHWTNGLAQEKARMLLCLSWLVRVEDTPEHRGWLYAVLADLMTLQDDCGAIQEELGDLKMGRYPPPQSNAAYGTNEASLLGRNGDKVCDLLYTTNFAFIGLHEAAHATDDPKIKEASDRLAEFLCRIQVKSPNHPEIDGGWFRAFDYDRFEHWGCNADHGWGAWCIESGWTQGWITSILALREMDTSIWELTNDLGVAKSFDSLMIEMGLNGE